MVTLEEKEEIIDGQWKDPNIELPEKDERVLAAIEFLGSVDYDIIRFNGEGWIDSYGSSFKVIAWMEMPLLPKNWRTI